jgi:aspartyl-tRNA(Asn)/glutamyl-tRNA(Gln) amidotransferase subunit B
MAAEIIPNIPMNGSVWELKVSPENLSLLVGMIFTGEISGKIAKEVIPEMLKTGASAQEIISSKGLSQISDEQTLTNVIRKVIDNNKDQVAAYRSGKLQLYGFFVGQVMKETSGQANPKITNELLKKELA